MLTLASDNVWEAFNVQWIDAMCKCHHLQYPLGNTPNVHSREMSKLKCNCRQKGVFVSLCIHHDKYMYVCHHSNESLQDQHLEQVKTWVSCCGNFSDYVMFLSCNMRCFIVLLTTSNARQVTSNYFTRGFKWSEIKVNKSQQPTLFLTLKIDPHQVCFYSKVM